MMEGRASAASADSKVATWAVGSRAYVNISLNVLQTIAAATAVPDMLPRCILLLT